MQPQSFNILNYPVAFITESLVLEGALEIIWSNTMHRLGPTAAGCSKLCPAIFFECVQGHRLFSLSGQLVQVFGHPHRKKMFLPMCIVIVQVLETVPVNANVAEAAHAVLGVVVLQCNRAGRVKNCLYHRHICD